MVQQQIKKVRQFLRYRYHVATKECICLAHHTCISCGELLAGVMPLCKDVAVTLCCSPFQLLPSKLRTVEIMHGLSRCLGLPCILCNRKLKYDSRNAFESLIIIWNGKSNAPLQGRNACKMGERFVLSTVITVQFTII